MNIIQRYLAITVLKAIGLAVLVLAAISGIIELLREMADVGTGFYGITSAIIYVFSLIPQHIYEFFPMAGLIGCILGLGMLATRSELIALRAAGFSLTDITLAVLKTALIAAILISLLGETIVPHLRLWADSYKTLKTSSGKAYTTQHGMWIRSQNDFVHIDLIAAPTKLYGITRYELDNQGRLERVSYAKQALFQDGEWQLLDIQSSNISETGVSNITVPSISWSISLPPDILKVAVVEPMQMGLTELYHYIIYRQKAGLSNAEYALSFWQRLFQPLAAAVMILIAVPFISGSIRSATMGLKLLLGIVAGFLFYILNQFFGPMSMVYQLPAILAALLPTLVFALIGLGLIKRVR